jgi:hypothetical protein
MLAPVARPVLVEFVTHATRRRKCGFATSHLLISFRSIKFGGSARFLGESALLSIANAGINQANRGFRKAP